MNRFTVVCEVRGKMMTVVMTFLINDFLVSDCLLTSPCLESEVIKNWWQPRIVLPIQNKMQRKTLTVTVSRLLSFCKTVSNCFLYLSVKVYQTVFYVCQ